MNPALAIAYGDAVGMAGPPPTALTPEAKGSRGGRFAVQVKAGFAEIVPAETLLQQMPNNLKISRLVVIP
jgi:hypothetical protein